MKLYTYAEYILGRKLKFQYLPGSTPRGYPEESPEEKKFIGGTTDTLGIYSEFIGGTDRIYSAYAKFYPRRGFLYPCRAGTRPGELRPSETLQPYEYISRVTLVRQFHHPTIPAPTITISILSNMSGFWDASTVGGISSFSVFHSSV